MAARSRDGGAPKAPKVGRRACGHFWRLERTQLTAKAAQQRGLSFGAALMQDGFALAARLRWAECKSDTAVTLGSVTAVCACASARARVCVCCVCGGGLGSGLAQRRHKHLHGYIYSSKRHRQPGQPGTVDKLEGWTQAWQSRGRRRRVRRGASAEGAGAGGRDLGTGPPADAAAGAARGGAWFAAFSYASPVRRWRRRCGWRACIGAG